MRRAQGIDAIGAALAGVVFVIVLLTKFLNGAYLIAINHHYVALATETARKTSRNHVLMLVSRVSGPTLRALAHAQFLRTDTLTVITVTADDRESMQYTATGLPPTWAIFT